MNIFEKIKEGVYTKSRRLVFVNLSVNSGYYGVNHGIAYLTPIAKKHLYDVVVVNIRKEITPQQFREQIEKLEPSIIGYSFTSPQYKYYKIYADSIKNKHEYIQIAGGVGPTLSPDDVIQQEGVNGVLVGEGEHALSELLDGMNGHRDIRKIQGFYWKDDGRIIKNIPPQFPRDLAQLPFPDYSVFERSLVVGDGNIGVLLSRGCPYSCTYCCNKALGNVYQVKTHYYRQPSVRYCIDFLESLLSQYPEATHISFEDDLLIAQEKWFSEFSQEYARKIALPCRVNVRTECINHSIVESLTLMKCATAFIGLESGNEDVRFKVLNRRHSNADIIKKAKMIKDAGIRLHTFNIVGFPFETPAQMEETYALNREIQADEGICTFFYPFAGSELYEICKKENMLCEDMQDISNYNYRPAIKLSIENIKTCYRVQEKLMRYFDERIIREMYKINNKIALYFLTKVKGVVRRNGSVFDSNKVLLKLYRFLRDLFFGMKHK